MKTELIPIDKIVWYSFLRSYYLEDFDAIIKDGKIKEPISVIKCSDCKFLLLDGALRISAAKDLKLKEIEARVFI